MRKRERYSGDDSLAQGKNGSHNDSNNSTNIVGNSSSKPTNRSIYSCIHLLTLSFLAPRPVSMSVLTIILTIQTMTRTETVHTYETILHRALLESYRIAKVDLSSTLKESDVEMTHQIATAKMLNYCIRMLHADGWVCCTMVFFIPPSPLTPLYPCTLVHLHGRGLNANFVSSPSSTFTYLQCFPC